VISAPSKDAMKLPRDILADKVTNKEFLNILNPLKKGWEQEKNYEEVLWR
jgi:hypothetical protein